MKDPVTLLLTIATIIIPVFATIYTGHIRIRNENKEEHKPYLSLGQIEALKQIDRFSYFFIIFGKSYEQIPKKDIVLRSRTEPTINLSLTIKNIGYGVASNIKFYDLKTSKTVLGVQERSEEINQKKFTTFDISKDTKKRVQVCILPSIEKDIVQNEEHCILCVYQDLNENIYDFIIGIDMKKGGTFDFFAYQRSSHSYQKLVSAYRDNYKSIMRKYKK